MGSGGVGEPRCLVPPVLFVFESIDRTIEAGIDSSVVKNGPEKCSSWSSLLFAKTVTARRVLWSRFRRIPRVGEVDTPCHAQIGLILRGPRSKPGKAAGWYERCSPQMLELRYPIEEARMDPDILRDRTSGRRELSKDLRLDTWRTEALPRLLSDSGRYPHCPKCGRAMLAESAEQFSCPDAHATITRPVQSRRESLRRLLRMITGQPPDQSGA
jgi:predicted RNA-binding Zn-ribbon protein involved in translation (DUF1610 family)